MKIPKKMKKALIGSGLLNNTSVGKTRNKQVKYFFEVGDLVSCNPKDRDDLDSMGVILKTKSEFYGYPMVLFGNEIRYINPDKIRVIQSAKK